MKIKSIEPMSCGKVAGVLYGVVGLFIGAIVALVGDLSRCVVPAENLKPALVGCQAEEYFDGSAHFPPGWLDWISSRI